MGSITLKCNSLHYNYFGKMCHYITLQLLYFVNVINYIKLLCQSNALYYTLHLKTGFLCRERGEGGLVSSK